MGDLLTTAVPLFIFMMIPIWIPIAAAFVGAVADRLRPTTLSPAQRAVGAAKSRTAAVAGQRTVAPATVAPAGKHRQQDVAVASVAA